MKFAVHVDQTFVRSELRFSVRVVAGQEDPFGDAPLPSRRPARWKALLETLDCTQRPTIIYTMSRRESERLGEALTEAVGHQCLAYHAGLPQDQRRVIEESFLHGDCECIVATNAFGMGIDKDDVRSVIHWQVPATPEALYQEAGRAGRGVSGIPAKAVLLFHENDLIDAYRTLRRDVPTRWEIERTDLVLRELADHQRRSVVTVADEDLQRLATLRPDVQQRVVIAHLERAGLVTELDRLYGARSVRLTGKDAGSSTVLEVEILKLVPPDGECVGIAAVSLVGLGGSEATREVWRALRGLERRGVIEQCRLVSVRLLAGDPSHAIASAREATNEVWAELEEHRQNKGPRVFHRGLDRHGDLALLRTAVEVLAAFGVIQVRHESADGSIPAVRIATSSSMDLLHAAFEHAGSITRSVRDRDPAATIPLHDLARTADMTELEILSGLTLLHLVGVASVDLRSWEDGSASVARVIEISDVSDRDKRLAEAIAMGLARARASRLRLEALRRYALIEAGDDADDIDPYQAFLEQYLTEPDFLDQIASETTSDLLAPLTETQRGAVLARPSEPVVMLAGPGAGKTRTVVNRIAYRVRAGYVLPERVLAITFTRAATEEVRARLARLGVRGVDVRTLDSLSWRIVRENWAALGFAAQPNLVDDQHAIVRRACPGANVSRVVSAINLLKSRRHALLEDDHLAYQAELERRNQMDFGDVKAVAAAFLSDDRRAQRYLESVDEVYVDEFQDLSPLQIDLVDAISPLAHLTIVGDPRQAIYEWNGASPHELIRRHAAGSQPFDLVENFRSTRTILDLANRIIEKKMPELQKVAPFGPGSGPAVSRRGLQTEKELTEHVVEKVRSWLNSGIPDAEIAVLAYKNSVVADLARALRARSITAHEVGLPKLSSTHAMVVLRLALTSDIESDPEEALLEHLDRLRASDAVEQALAGQDEGEATQNHDDWERLRAAIDEKRRSGAADLRSAVEAIRRADDGPTTRTGVTVTTMTRAKGLEWVAVAVADLGDDAMADWANDPERCRLVYVSVTRAKAHLDLSWTGRPTKWLS